MSKDTSYTHRTLRNIAFGMLGLLALAVLDYPIEYAGEWLIRALSGG